MGALPSTTARCATPHLRLQQSRPLARRRGCRRKSSASSSFPPASAYGRGGRLLTSRRERPVPRDSWRTRVYIYARTPSAASWAQAREMQAERPEPAARRSPTKQLRSETHAALGRAGDRPAGRNAALRKPTPGRAPDRKKWEAFNRERGGTYQTTQVERPAIQQLDRPAAPAGSACRPAGGGTRPAAALAGRRPTGEPRLAH